MTSIPYVFPAFAILLSAHGAFSKDLDAVPASQLRQKAAEIESELEKLPRFLPAGQIHGRFGFHGRPSKSNWIVVDLGRVTTPDAVVLFPARGPDSVTGEIEGGFPPELEVEMAGDDTFTDSIRLGRWEEEKPGASSNPNLLLLKGNGSTGRFLRIRIFGSRSRPTAGGTFYSLGEIVILENGANIALGRPITSSASIENPPRWQRENLTDGYLWCLPFRGMEPSHWNGYHSAIESDSPSHEKWVEVDLESEKEFDTILLTPAHPQDFADVAGFGFPPSFHLSAFREDGSESVIFDTADTESPNPGASTLMIATSGAVGRRVRFSCSRLWQRTGDYHFALAEIQVASRGEIVSDGRPVFALDSVETGKWSKAALTDGFSSRRNLLTWDEWAKQMWRREELSWELASILPVMEARASRIRQRWLYGLVALTLSVGLLSAIGMLWQRKRALADQEKLRTRIAADLHDELGANLSHIALQSDLAGSKLGHDDPVRTRLADLSKSARTSLDNMRDMIWLLGSNPGDWTAFQARLESIAERLLSGVAHTFHSEGGLPDDQPPLDWTREVVFFFKEALTNARKHSSAGKIEIILKWTDNRVTITIADDGKGFHPQQALSDPGRTHHGLRNLERRAESIRGTCEILSAPGEGTSVILTSPIPPSVS